MKPYRAYVFDLYGTLVDIHTDERPARLWAALAAYYTARGAVWNGPALRAAYLQLCAEETARLEAAFPGAAVEIDLGRVFAGLYALRGVEASAQMIAQTALQVRRASTTHLRAYAGAAALLSALRGRAEVVLLSNAQSLFTRPELRQLGLADSFDRIFISSEIGFKKPDARFYAAMLADAGLAPGDCLMIGNDPDCDIRGAGKAGLDAFYVHSALSPQPAPAYGALPCVGRLDRMDLTALRRELTAVR